MEFAALAAVLAVGAALLTRHLSRSRRLLAVGAALGVAAPLVWSGAAHNQTPYERFGPADATRVDGAEYASSRACRSCHPAEYASWARTFHRTMTQRAEPGAVLGDWRGTLSYGPRDYHLRREGDRFLVDMPRYGTNGETAAERVERPVVMTTGSHHMQAYWVPVPGAERPPENEGRSVFEQLCVRCHGEQGRGAGVRVAVTTAPAEPLRAAPVPLDEAVAAPVDAPPGEGVEYREVPALFEGELEPGSTLAALDAHERAQWLTTPLGAAQRAAVAHYVDRLQATGPVMQFPFIWFIRDGRWLHESYTFLEPPLDPETAEPFDQPWSESCDACHSVAPSWRWAEDAQRGDADVAELGIACEACHGPAAGHVAKHRAPWARYTAHLAGLEDDVVNPAKLDPERGASVCGQCHAELEVRDGPDFRPGMRLRDTAHVVQRLEPQPDWLKRALEAEPELLRDGFWRDGTVRIAGRDYNGLLESPCHSEGPMDCTTCHTMHAGDPRDQLKPEATTDRVCVDCHPAQGADRAGHTRHAAGTPGAGCYDCHMPHTTWGLLTAMRAHRVDSPTAEMSATYGRPNACSLCHLDRPLSAIAAQLDEWYGQPPPSPAERTEPAGMVWMMEGDAVQRAIAAWHVARPESAPSEVEWAPYLGALLDDPYPAVRYVAGQALRRLEGFRDFEYDFVAPGDARQRVFDRWEERGHVVPRARIADMQSRRDDTEIGINE